MWRIDDIERRCTVLCENHPIRNKMSMISKEEINVVNMLVKLDIIIDLGYL